MEGNKEIKQGLLTTIDKLVPNDDENDQLMDELKNFRDALGTFATPSAIRKREKMSPCKFF